MLSKISLLFVSIFAINFSFAQDFDKKITDVATEIASKITATGKQNVAIVEFDNLDGSQSQLGVFLSDEIASSLAMQSSNQTKFTVLERANLDLILQEKKILKSFDRSKLAKDLGKINAAEILISASITEFNGYYRLNIKLLDTKSGNSLGSYKVSFVQEPSLKELQKESVESTSTTTKSTTTIQTEPKNVVNSTPQTQVQTKEVIKGDVCFNNSSISYSAVVHLKNVETGQKVKTIDVIALQKACAYNIPIGVYQMEINWWINSNSKIDRTDTRDIIISTNSENIIEIKHH